MEKDAKQHVRTFSVYVGNLSPQCTEGALCAHFQEYEPESVRIVSGKNGKPKGFVNFRTIEQRNNSKILDQSKLLGKIIQVDVSAQDKKKEKEEKIGMELIPRQFQIVPLATPQVQFSSQEQLVQLYVQQQLQIQQQQLQLQQQQQQLQLQQQQQLRLQQQPQQQRIEVQLGNKKKENHIRYHIVFAIDCSGSMGENTSDSNSKRIDAVKTSFLDFLDTRKSKRDLCSIIRFNDESAVVCESQPYWKKVEEMKQHIYQLTKPSGATNYSKALSQCYDLIKKHRETKHNKRDPVIVFLSDGLPNEGGTGEAEMKKLVREFKYLQVFLIGFCTDGKELLQNLAKIAGKKGHFRESTTEIHLRNVFTSISKDFLKVTVHSK